MIKCDLTVLGIVLVAIALIVFTSLSSATSSGQPVNVAGYETQFKLNIDYAYVGALGQN